MRFPKRTDGTVEAVLLNTAGGLTDGDAISNEICWKATSRATVTTQAAERIYRAAGEHSATVTTRIRIEEDCVACWLPQETIVFDGSRLTRTLDIDMPSGSTLIALESTVFGRRAMGEIVNDGRVSDRWRIRIDGRLAFADNFLVDHRLDGRIDAHLKRASVADAAHCMSTLVFVGDDSDKAVEHARTQEAPTQATIGATCLGRVSVMRILAEDSRAMRNVIGGVVAELGSSVGIQLPRVWHC